MINFTPMDQAGRIIAGMKGGSTLAGQERIACGAWKRAVGKRLAVRTNPVRLSGDVLVIEVEDQVWRDSLRKLRYQILRNIEREIGPEVVSDLQFIIAPLRKDPQRAASAVPGRATDEADAIADPGMRLVYRNSRRRLSA